MNRTKTECVMIKNMFLTSSWPWPSNYQRIGNWKVNILALISYESDENWACYDQNMLLTFSQPWPWPLTYQRIGNWKVNILALVSYESDENWACCDQNMFLTFSWPWPWPLTNHRIWNWKVKILVLVSYESDENWVCYDRNMFLTFSWLWPWLWPIRDRELKSEPFGVGFIWIGWKLSVLWPKCFLPFCDLDLDLWPVRG